MDPVKVCMLGDFTLQAGSHVLRESGSRSRRIFSLLAFLICHREHPVSQHRLIQALWDNPEDITNPENTLRILLHRTRSQLDLLWEGAGRECILRRDGSYCWNHSVPVIVDYERFEQLCQHRDCPEEDRLRNLQEALSLYRGEFLARQASESWVIPIGAHFQNLFLLASQEAAQLLYRNQQYDEAAVGWILIPDTRINYPLLQGSDNDYYLKRTWDQRQNAVGSIFLEHLSSPDLSDFNTIVYGHNMRDGSMFAGLRKYRDQSYYEEHPYVYIRSDQGVYRYEIFASCLAGINSDAYSLGFPGEEARSRFLDNVLADSFLSTGIRPEITDRILTLSTCSGAGYTTRWVVQARLKMVPVQS